MTKTIVLFVLGLRLLVARPGPGLVIFAGMAGFIAVAVSLFVIANAFDTALTGTGKPDRALLLRSGSNSEINGNVPLSQYPIVRELPELAQASDGGLAARESYITVNLPRRADGADATLSLRGVTAASYAVRPEIRITAGEHFSPGTYELIAGSKAAQLWRGLTPGNTIRIRGQSWRVTGLFSAANSASETELWVDERLLAQTLGRGETFSSILVRLASPDAFEPLKQRLLRDPRLTLSAHRESEFYAQQAAPTSGLIRGLGWVVGFIMALGALSAAFNTMETALSERAREIATLRTLGFERGAILAAITMECVLLSLLGAGLAIAGVTVLLDGSTLSTVAAATTSGAQVAFVFRVQLPALLLAAGLAIILGLLGGLIPGLAAIRRPLPAALRGA